MATARSRGEMPEIAGMPCLGSDSSTQLARRFRGQPMSRRAGEFPVRPAGMRGGIGVRPLTMRSGRIAARAAGLVLLAAGLAGCASGPSTWVLPHLAEVFTPATLPNPLPVPNGDFDVVW